MFKYLLVIASLMFAVPQIAAAQAAKAAEPTQTSATEYCTSKGGTVQVRIPTYGTNGNNPLSLAYERQFCDFTSKDGQTNIYVQLSTLVSHKPTLAALAYYAAVQVDLSGCHGGPGSCYCADIGGTDAFGGINAAGGGWVLNTNNTDVLDVCVFPDESAIDSYGVFYHAYGITRGQKLDHKFAFHNPY
jgi:putative hemolysin